MNTPVSSGDRVKEPTSPVESSFAADSSSCEIRSPWAPKSLEDGRMTANHHPNLVREVVQLLVETWEKQSDKNSKVLDFKLPKELETFFDLKLSSVGASDDKMFEVCKSIVDLSLHSGHPAFFNQLWGGLDEYGLLGAWMVETLHTSVYTYEVAPLFTLMEQYVVGFVGKELIQYPNEAKIDGLFNPGGSLSNIMAMTLARYRLDPKVKTEGNLIFKEPLVIFTSDESHYSLSKGAATMGLGSNNVWKVPTDELGQMLPEKLEERISEAKNQNKIPLIVCATSGTTVLGAYDPLEPIADICKKYGIWMHVDAAWGGAAMFSPKLRHMVKGIERSDSVTWNPHKMLGIPLQCAMFLTRHKNLLQECNSAKSSYLFQSDKFYDMEYDIGDKTFQCGRKNDVLKLWLTWKGRGTAGLTAAVENAFEMAHYFFQLIQDRPGFHMVLPKVQCTNICFWFIPPSLRKNINWESTEFRDKLSMVAPRMKQRMMEQGTLFIGYQPIEHRKLPNFFRLVLHCNPPPTHESMQFVVDEMERLGADL